MGRFFPGTKSGKRQVLFLLAAALLLSMGTACQRLEVDRLFLLPLDESPGWEHWSGAVALPLKAGGGHVNGLDERLEGLKRDTDPVHVGSASCHHGPPITNPVMIETRGYYTEEEIHLEVRWEDPTVDTEPRRWEMTEKGWLLGDGDQDGIAILWSRGGGSFGCQEACHMSDFTLRQGELIDLRSMRMAREEEWEEAWVWKPSQGGQALILDSDGFRLPGSEEPYRRLNSAMAVDDSLSPEARRAGTFAPGDRPLEDGGGRAADRGTVTAPAYLFGGSGEKGGLSVRAERKSDGWHVVFSRALAAGARRQSFRSGETYRFGMAVFDGTSIDHHLVRDTQTLELVRLPATALSKKKRGIVSGPGGEIL